MIDYLKSIPLTLIISLVVILAFAFPQLFNVLEYNTQFNSVHQIVQLLGCHLLHWSGEHLFWDLGMFALLGAICERSQRRTFAIVLFFSAILIPPAVGFWNPNVGSYRGLSGLDTAIFGLAVMRSVIEKLRESDRTGLIIYSGLLIGMLVKISHELTSGSTLFVASSNFSPVPIAHVIGATIGIFAGIVTNIQGTNQYLQSKLRNPTVDVEAS